LPLVSLDTHFYGLLKDFEERFQVVPSLVEAESLTVRGDVLFSHPLTIKGNVAIQVESSGRKVLPADTVVLENEEIAL
jgi:UTP--glucose-1-phosphate uridylyltransferase